MAEVAKEFLADFFNPVYGECVICGEQTRNQCGNNLTGQFDFVHDYDEPEYAGCKEVWRYRLHREERIAFGEYRRERWAAGDIWESDYDPDENELTDRDYYHDYHSYIASSEWEIKSRSLKGDAKWKCERCGRRGSNSTLHVHHKHYRTLYRERRKDLEVLCPNCHRQQHGK